MVLDEYRMKGKPNGIIWRIDRAFTDLLNIAVWGRPFYHPEELNLQPPSHTQKCNIPLKPFRSILEISASQTRRKRKAKRSRLPKVNPALGISVPPYVPPLPPLESTKMPEIPKVRRLSVTKPIVVKISEKKAEKEEERKELLVEGV